MRLSHASTYAVHALAHLAAAGEKRLVLSYDIARAWGISERYLPKVLRRLVSAQLLRSLKGPREYPRLIPKCSSLIDRPTRAAASSMTFLPLAASSGVQSDGSQPSPRRPHRSSAAGVIPPSHASSGCWWGTGERVTPSKSAYWP